MKVRQGFVSNSSSSSFVILGIKTTATDRKKWNALVEATEDHYGPPKGCKLEEACEGDYIGLKVSMNDDDYDVVRAFSPEDFSKAMEQLEQYLGRKCTISMFLGREGC